MAEHDVKVGFASDLSGLVHGFAEAKETIVAQSEGITQAFESIRSALLAMTAVVAGGEMFKEFIDKTVEMNEAARHLSARLGITAEAADLLGASLALVGVSTESYASMAMHLDRQVRSNEEGLRAMGLEVRNADGTFKDQATLIEDGVKNLENYKAGTDRNMAAQAQFGRGVGEVNELMRINAQLKEQAAKDDEELALTVNDQSVEAVLNYKMALVEVDQVIEGVSNTVGSRLIPILTDTAWWFRSQGPGAIAVTREAIEAFVNITGSLKDALVSVLKAIGDIISTGLQPLQTELGYTIDGFELFSNIMKAIAILAEGLSVGIQELVQIFKLFVETILNVVMGLAQAQKAMLTLDFSGARNALRKTEEQIKSDFRQTMSEMADIAQAGQNKIVSIIEGQAKPAEKEAKKDTGTKSFGGAKGSGDLGKARLAIARAEDEAELALQLEYLSEAAKIYDDVYKNNLISVKEYYAARLAIEVGAIDASISAKTKELEVTKAQEKSAKDQAKRLEMKAQDIKLTGELNVLEAKRAAAFVQNASEMMDAQKKLDAQLHDVSIRNTEAAGLAQVEADRANLELRKSLRQTDAQQALAEESNFEDRIYALKHAALEAQMRDIQNTTNDPVKKAQIDAQLEELERTHQANLTKIKHAALAEQGKDSIAAQQTVEGAFSTFTYNLLEGVMTIKSAFKSLFVSIVQGFEKIIAQRFAEKMFGAGTAGGKFIDSLISPFVAGINKLVGVTVAGEAAKTSAVTAGAATRAAVETQATSIGLATQAAGIIKSITNYASEAFSGVWASLSGIPVVGPAMAAAEAPMAMATVMAAAGSVASSAGGDWMIPSARMNLLHPKETILPADKATKLDAMLDSGLGGGSPLNVTIHAVDASGVKKLFMDHGSALADALRKQTRNFKPMSPLRSPT